MPRERRQARILAMQALCQWDVQHDETEAPLREVLTEFSEDGCGVGYAAELVRAVWARRGEVDEYISAAARRWDISRISLVERNVMRVAVVEMLGGVVPPKVALHEAVEIGDEFGGAESPRFLNGVLDAVLHRIEGERDRSEDGG